LAIGRDWQKRRPIQPCTCARKHLRRDVGANDDALGADKRKCRSRGLACSSGDIEDEGFWSYSGGSEHRGYASGSLMYMLENDVQPEVFTSIPVAMWWAIETLTTVGYGDIVPMTVAGRVVGGCVSIIGIGTLALFSGLITVGFLDQLRTYREEHGKAGVIIAEESVAIVQNFAVTEVGGEQAAMPTVCPHCGHVLAPRAIRRGAGNGNQALRV
jgi:Ion channel